MTKLQPFHLAIPVRDLQEARHFYGNILGCEEGRCDETWLDFNFYGHQLVIHLLPVDERVSSDDLRHNSVDGHNVPVPHFGIVLGLEEWQALTDRLKSHHIQFIIEPTIRFKGKVGEQATMFFLDPSGNALEFKAFRNIDQLFAK